ncbi:Na/Pi cotransporter family protein [Pontibacter sp. JAM-7]|uniref:Na/Pi cotransporter family protein n=1 Tax=Pontibacter sp. JAM-7 TaxID=3366581 RepID=UPI003AF585B3
MDFMTLSGLLGGLALFMLGMQLMTEGLRQAAGKQLKQILQTGTDSDWRGLSSGTLITTLVQSSSVVTVATIGFVNAGLLNLRQSITVILGCNLGTTATGWLVALIGFKLSTHFFALPILALGMALRLLGRHKKLAHLGTALAGFGLFFVGLDVLKTTLEGFQQTFTLQPEGVGLLGLASALLAGFILTVVMQSSSAAMVVILSLIASTNLPISAMAAAVIGANLGTTSTAVLAVIGATANAKRIAAAHVVFNLITGMVGLLLLLPARQLLDNLSAYWDPVLLLAGFHTLFNLLGIILFWRFIFRLSQFLERLFRTQEENLSAPQFLDRNILTTPTLALEAMSQELTRVSQLTSALARQAISSELTEIVQLERQRDAILSLCGQIADYNQKIARESLSEETSKQLPIALRVTRYYSHITQLAAHLPTYYDTLAALANAGLNHQINEYQQAAITLIDSCEIQPDSCYETNAHLQLLHLEKQYQRLKTTVLEQTVQGHLPGSESITLLDSLSQIHQLSQQVEKAARYWSSMLPLQIRQQPTHDHSGAS